MRILSRAAKVPFRMLNWLCINVVQLSTAPNRVPPRNGRPSVLMALIEPGHPFYESWRRGVEANGWNVCWIPRSFELHLSHQLLLYFRLCLAVRVVHLIDVDLQTLFGEHNAARRALSFAALRLIIFWPRLLRKRVVYCFGNVVPHEFDTAAERRRHKLICSLADGVISMSPSQSEGLCVDGIPTERIWPAEHADIASYFTAPGHGCEVRRAYGISESAILLLCPGTIRPYKGIEVALEGLRKAAEPNLRLIVAGKPACTYTSESILRMAEGDPRIVIGPLRSLSNEEMGQLFQAADYCLLPYRAISHSGLICQALGLGVPVIGSRVGCLPDYLAGGAGLLFEQGNSDELSHILDGLRSFDRQKARSIGLAIMRQRTPEHIGQRLVAAYDGSPQPALQSTWLYRPAEATPH